MPLEYSVAIRSIGNSDWRFIRLIKSLESQTVIPNEVIIVLPSTVKRWNIKTNLKIRWVFSKKGMVSQRMTGIDNIKSSYALLLDDDIEFSQELAEKLLTPIINNHADITVPYFSQFIPKGKIVLLNAFFGIAIPRKDVNTYIDITLGGGFKYPRSEPPRTCKTQSGVGPCIAARIDSLLFNKIGRDIFLDTSPYSAREDTAFLFGAHQKGLRVYMIPNINISHLQGGTALDSNRDYYNYYSLVRNQIYFWRNYIYSSLKDFQKISSLFMLIWYLIGCFVLALAISFRLFSFKPLSGYLHGVWSSITHSCKNS
jgi:glycosyltransferase involved in cell wall biosynthesis